MTHIYSPIFLSLIVFFSLQSNLLSFFNVSPLLLHLMVYFVASHFLNLMIILTNSNLSPLSKHHLVLMFVAWLIFIITLFHNFNIIFHLCMVLIIAMIVTKTSLKLFLSCEPQQHKLHYIHLSNYMSVTFIHSYGVSHIMIYSSIIQSTWYILLK